MANASHESTKQTTNENKQHLGHHSGRELFWVTDKHELCSCILQWNKVVHFCTLAGLSAEEEKTTASNHLMIKMLQNTSDE